MWQVESRSLTTSAQQSSPYSYTVAWPDASNSVPLHTSVTLDDAYSGTERYWSFNPTGQNSAGLVSELQYRSAPGVTSPLPRDEAYTWSQDSNSNSYLGTVATTLDKGATYAPNDHYHPNPGRLWQRCHQQYLRLWGPIHPHLLERSTYTRTATAPINRTISMIASPPAR